MPKIHLQQLFKQKVEKGYSKKTNLTSSDNVSQFLKSIPKLKAQATHNSVTV